MKLNSVRDEFQTPNLIESKIESVANAIVNEAADAMMQVRVTQSLRKLSKLGTSCHWICFTKKFKIQQLFKWKAGFIVWFQETNTVGNDTKVSKVIFLSILCRYFFLFSLLKINRSI